MIDTHGNVRPGRPRRGHEVIEYQRVKADIIEMLDVETPDKEIAARLGLSRSGFYQLKKRILKEMVGNELALNVAAREYMRLNRQMSKLVEYMDRCWETTVAPDASYITAFTNLSRRIADLVGANAAIAISIDHGADTEEGQALRSHQLDMARELNRFYELQDRLRGDQSIGSGLTKAERDRELDNLRAALPAGEDVRPADFGLGDDDSDDPDIEDAVEVLEAEAVGFDEDQWHEGYVEVERTTKSQRRVSEIEAAAGAGDPETPGRWVAGKFVSWWHDLGEDEALAEDTFDFDMQPLTSALDDEVWPSSDDGTGDGG